MRISAWAVQLVLHGAYLSGSLVQATSTVGQICSIYVTARFAIWPILKRAAHLKWASPF